MLNKNESKVLEVIERDSFISQQAIADELGLTRSTVATIISSLTQKKHLLGRAYVMNHSSGVYCIGAMNVDRKYTLFGELVPKTSNPVSSNISVGGVARNVAENLGRMQVNVSLISLGGHDQDYHYLLKETEAYVNMQHTTQLNGYATGTYNAILDNTGEMQLAIADMQIYDEMTVEWLSNYQSILQTAQILVVDLNLPRETVDYVLSLARKFDIDLFIIPVSGPKMSHLSDDLTAVTWMIVNQDESETYFNIKVETEDEFEKLADRWLEAGVENVVVTRGSRSSIYGNASGERRRFIPPTSENLADVTGAGDAYASGIVYGVLNNFDAVDSIHLGMTNAHFTIQSKDTVRTELDEETLNKETNLLFQKEIN